MGSHAKPRTTGRKTAIGALTLGATLTGIGLTAAALDPATAVLTANGEGTTGTTQLSGLSSPIALDLSPAADSVTNLTSAPLQSVSSVTNAVNGALGGGTQGGGILGSGIQGSGTRGGVQNAGSAAKPAGSGALGVSAKQPSTRGRKVAASANSGSMNSIKPINAVQPVLPALTGGSTTRTGRTRAAAAPTQAAASNVLPAAQSLASKVPVVSGLVQGGAIAGTAAGLVQSATGTATGTVSSSAGDPAIGTATGIASGSAGNPVTGALGGLPLVGSLLGRVRG